MTSITVKIGVIGPDNIVGRIESALSYFPNFEPVYKISNNIYDAPTFTEELIDEVEILFYSGYLPYSLSKENIPSHIPAHYIPLKGTGLFRSLYLLNKELPDSIKGLSVDSIKESDCLLAMEELEETYPLHSYPEPPTIEQTNQMVEYHTERIEKGEANAVLTGIKIVAEELNHRNIPAHWILPTQEDIVNALERALLSTKTRRNRESQIVFGIIKINDYDQHIAKQTSESDIQRLNLKLNSLLLNYIDRLEGYLTELNRQEFLFVTTRGVFERVTEGYKYIPLLDESQRKLDLSLSIGVGFGFSSKDAGSHARIALGQATDYGKSTCFIVREDKSVIGPVEMGAPLTYDLSVTDETLLENARKAGMTPAYLNKLIALIKRKDLNQFTAQELASLLNITTRSAHRILLQWLDADIIEVVGTEKITSKGRPRQIFRLLTKEETP